MPLKLVKMLIWKALMLLLLRVVFSAKLKHNTLVDRWTTFSFNRWDMVLPRNFEIDWENNCFLKDGEPFRYISGTMHYFRVPSCYWEDRLRKMKAAGLNAVETYIAWHVHESVEGVYNFSGDADVLHFLKLANEVGLLVILRPGPFIDAERDFGGLPPWLLNYGDIKFRTSDPVYLGKVGTWYSFLLPKLKPFLYENGGPIIMVQIENEYGSFYACDKEYLGFLKTTIQQHLGTSILLFTVDGAFDEKEIICGGLDDVFKTVDFGANSDISTAFNTLRKVQPKGPLVNTEFYTGWLDHWGEPHQTKKTELIASALDKLLSLGASVNILVADLKDLHENWPQIVPERSLVATAMNSYANFQPDPRASICLKVGQIFAYWNGAEVMKSGRYAPEPTSYDYDAPLSEAGDLTEKYYAIRDVIAKHAPHQIGNLPVPVKRLGYGVVKMSKALSLFQSLPHLVPDGPVESKVPRSMEDLNQAYGYMLYSTELILKNAKNLELVIDTIRDRALVFVDLVFQGIIDRNTKPELTIAAGKQLDLLVENQGRVNYKYGNFTNLRDPKGILGNVRIDGAVVHNWKTFNLPLNNLQNLDGHFSSEVKTKVPGFFVGHFSSSAIGDTYLKTRQWSKGQAFINGFNLGRYWPTAGPQLTLYVPRCLLREPPLENEIILFETDGVSCKELTECFVEFVAEPEWKN